MEAGHSYAQHIQPIAAAALWRLVKLTTVSREKWSSIGHGPPEPPNVCAANNQIAFATGDNES